MIIKFIFQIIIQLIGFIYDKMADVMPTLQVINYITAFFDLLQNFLQQAVNFVYLCIGPAMYTILPLIIPFIIWKYTIYPIAIIARRVFIKGGDE